MALGLIGLLDLSIVTDRLITLLKAYRDDPIFWPAPGNPTFNIDINGSAPEAVRSGADCVLSLYLFHVTESKHLRNSPLPHHLPGGTPPPAALRVPPGPAQPMALDLYYVLTAWADKDYVHEQKAMSIALKCFHENPVVRRTVLIGTEPVPEEFTLTMQVESMDEIGRLWQATTAPARLATVYRVGVVFLTPPAPAALAPKPKSVGLSLGVGDPNDDLPHLLGTHHSVTFATPGSTEARRVDLSPAVVAPGEALTLFGGALDQPLAQKIFLVDGETETDVTTDWHPSDAEDTATRIVVTLPANAPAAGVYQIRVGDGTYRSNATPFSIAARVTPPVSPAPPVLTPAGSVYTINGAGFIGAKTELFAGGLALAETGGAPAAGEFAIGGGGTSISFVLPAALPDGTHAVRVRVNGVESSPAWWVTKP